MKNTETTEEKEIMKLYKTVSPLVEIMKSHYQKEINIEGLKPALTADIIEIVQIENKRVVEEVIEKVKKINTVIGAYDKTAQDVKKDIIKLLKNK